MRLHRADERLPGLGSMLLPFDLPRSKSSSVPASHQSGTIRVFLPFVVSRRSRRCGRATSTTTSPSCRPAISETRSPQQHASRTMVRFRHAFADRMAFCLASARTEASSRRVATFARLRFDIRGMLGRRATVVRSGDPKKTVPSSDGAGSLCFRDSLLTCCDGPGFLGHTVCYPEGSNPLEPARPLGTD